jgi:hypothetical protein
MPMIDKWLLSKIKNFFKNSDHFHIRSESIGSTNELVELIDRFLDKSLKYGFEWDDFISWESEIEHVEKIRNEIGAHEFLLFSGQKADRALYDSKLLALRNHLAAQLNMKIRF